MGKKDYDRIYERVYRRFLRRAKRVSKSWREIEIDRKNFSETLKHELEKEEQKYEDSIQKQLDEFKKNILDEREPLPSPKVFYDPEGMRAWSRGFGKSDEQREQERKQLEKEVNEQLEEKCTRGICPICKSSICHCRKEVG